jgi:hypothetical protein
LFNQIKNAKFVHPVEKPLIQEDGWAQFEEAKE